MFFFMNNTGNSKLQPATHRSQLSGEMGSDRAWIKTPGSESADAEGRGGLWAVNQGEQREAYI